MNAETFNRLHRIGTPVFAYPGCRPEDSPKDTRLVTRTRSRASVLGGHTDVVWVDGHSACIALSHVDPVSESVWQAAKEAEETAAAVAAQGALPVPVGDQPQPLDDRGRPRTMLDRAREALNARMTKDDLRLVLENTITHAEALKDRVTELETEREKLVRWHREDGEAINRLVARIERRRAELVALRNDALNIRGSLSPNGEARKVPFPLGETLTPAVDWLINRVAELEAERHTTNEALSDAAEQLRANRDRIGELEAAADATEYGIRIPDGSVLSPTTSLAEEQSRLERYRDSWPEAELVQRPVFHGEWTPANLTTDRAEEAAS